MLSDNINIYNIMYILNICIQILLNPRYSSQNSMSVINQPLPSQHSSEESWNPNAAFDDPNLEDHVIVNY